MKLIKATADRICCQEQRSGRSLLMVFPGHITHWRFKYEGVYSKSISYSIPVDSELASRLDKLPTESQIKHVEDRTAAGMIYANELST